MTILEEFLAFAETKSGPYQTKNPCRCPMAEFARHKYPDATGASAGEYIVSAWKDVRSFPDLDFPLRFFTRFVETAGTWEELTARVRRAI